MKNLFAIVIVLGAALSFSSCKQKCIIDDAWVGEAIVTGYGDNVVLYPKSGYMTSNFPGMYKIDENHPNAAFFKVSFDGGMTKQDVNYNKYVIFANPKRTPCNSSFTREVVVGVNTVVYTVEFTKNCEEKCTDEMNDYITENYVLVNKSMLPASYNLVTN